MPALRSISSFKTALSGGGARPNLFEVELTDVPFVTNWANAKEDFSFLCKSAALPASNIGVIDMPFRGRILKLAGDRTFDTWTVTIINDENFKLRNAFEQWMDGISKLDNNTGATNPNTYMKNATVYQLGRGFNRIDSTSNVQNTTGNPAILKKYTFEGIFPTNISAIDLSYDSADTVEEFTVEFQVLYWTTTFTSASTSQGGSTTNTTTTPTATTTTPAVV